MRILVLGDNAGKTRLFNRLLTEARHNTTLANCPDEGVELARFYEFDLILLDQEFRDCNGQSVLRELRVSQVTNPIVIFSSSRDHKSKINALNAGADDYVTMPFNREEFLARISAIIRRSKGHAQSVIAIGDLEVDLERKTVSACGNDLRLKGKLYEIVELMALHKGKTITKDTFLNYLYGGINEPGSKIIDVCIFKLRKKLSAAVGRDDMIKSIRGRGYLMDDFSDDNPEFAKAA